MGSTEVSAESLSDEASPETDVHIVHACFEVDAKAASWLSVSKDLLPVMEEAGFRHKGSQPANSLGKLLGRVFAKELEEKTISRRQGGKWLGLPWAQDQGARDRATP